MHVFISAANDVLKDGAVYYCEYHYQPREVAVLHPIDKAYPGCAASIEIYSVRLIVDGNIIADDFYAALSQDELDWIESQIREQLSGE